MNDPHYTIIPDTVVKDAALARLLYGRILLYARSEFKACYATNESLGEDLGVSANTVRRNIALLKSRGYVHVTVIDANHRRITPLAGMEPPTEMSGGMPKNEHPPAQKWAHNNMNKEYDKKNIGKASQKGNAYATAKFLAEMLAQRQPASEQKPVGEETL